MPPRSASSLVHPLWRLSRPGGPARDLRLLPDGRVLGAGPRATWSLAGDVLTLAALDGLDPTLRLLDVATVETVPHFRAAAPAGDVTLRPELDDLHLEAALRGWGRPLVIVFASRGSPYIGGETRWQFFHLLLQERFNYVRISERVDPHFWYLNKTARLLGLLSRFLDGADTPVLLCGTSSGGYASLAFGERLSALHPGRPIRTFTINPQTVLGPAHSHHLRATVEDRFLPALIDDDAWAQRDADPVDIHALVAASHERRGDIRHVIHYDALNPAETYQLSFVSSLDGVDLRPHALGLSHHDGIRVMFEGGAAHEELKRAARS